MASRYAFARARTRYAEWRCPASTRREGTPVPLAIATWASLAVMSKVSRPVPPPLEGNDMMIIGIGTAAWLVALIVLVLAGGHLAPQNHWWIWTAATGAGFGLFAFWFVPRLNRARARSGQPKPPAAG